MTADRKISELDYDAEVCVLLDVDDSLLSFETTAGALVAKGFGSLQYECENPDVDVPTVFAKNLKQFDEFKAVFGKTNVKREVWEKLGRPQLPQEKRASQQIQIRATAHRKDFYTDIARANSMNLSEWMLWVCDKASGYTV